jgi:hypothetical protein
MSARAHETDRACTIELDVSEAPDAYYVCTRDAAGISSTYWKASMTATTQSSSPRRFRVIARMP